MTVRGRKFLALAALTVLAFTACGGDGNGGNGGTGSGLSGTFTIGVWGPASIPQGGDIRDGALLAAKELNDAGKGIDGKEIKIIFCDSIDGAQTDKAVDCARQFIQQDRVDAIVGGFSSGETLAILQTVADGETIFIASGAASPDVVKDVDSDGPRRFIFRIGPINSTFLAADMCGTMIQFGAAQGFSRFGILYEDVEFARPLQDFLAKCLVSPKAATGGQIPLDKGVEVVAVESHDVTADNFSSQFAKFTAAKAQFVIEINSRQEGIALVKQWGELKPDFALGGINVSSQFDAFFEGTEGNAAYELNGPAGSVRAPITPKTVPFYDAFKAEYGRFPIYNGVSTYDAIYVLADAAERAGSVDTEELIDALEQTDYVGAQGRERFGPNHDVLYGPAAPDGEGVTPVYFQWTPEGEKQLVFPSTLEGAAAYQKPAWLE